MTKVFQRFLSQFEKNKLKTCDSEPILWEFLTSLLALTFFQDDNERQQPKYNASVTVYPFITYLRVAAWKSQSLPDSCPSAPGSILFSKSPHTPNTNIIMSENYLREGCCAVVRAQDWK